MEKLSYKDWAWPQNPTEYRQSYLREPVYEKNAAGEQEFQGLGPLKKVITGSGVFTGPNAGANFQELASMVTESNTGLLVHPVLGTVVAYFTELELTQVPREDYLAYRFTFQVADGNGAIPY